MPQQIQQMDYRTLYSGFKENPEQVIADAKRAGTTLTHYLDKAAPPGYSAQPANDNAAGTLRTDVDVALEKSPVLQRILHDEDLPINSDPLAGHYACAANDFFETPFRRALFAELCYQRARQVWYGGISDERSEGKRAVLFNSDIIPGEILNAFYDRPGALLDKPFQPAIPISEIIAFTTFVPGQDYRALYFQRDEDEHRMVRVPEGTPVPSGVLRHREHTVTLPKRGRAIEFTYEMLRNPTTTIDRLLFQIQMIALESEVDLLEDAINVLRNGDENQQDNPTTTHSTDTRPYWHFKENGATLSGATRSNRTARDILPVYPDSNPYAVGKEEAWLAFEMRFQPPFVLNRILTRTREALELKRLTLFPTTAASSQELQMDLGDRSPFFPQIQPINPNAGLIRMGYIEPTEDSILPKGDIIGFDAGMALERVVETGSEIQEVETFVRSQTTVLVITENSNFCIFQPGAVRVLDWN